MMIEISLTLFGGLVIYVLGAVSVLLTIFYWVTIQESDQRKVFRKESIHETKLPELLMGIIKDKEVCSRKETCITLNLLLQFLYQERRYDIHIMEWLTRLVTQELSELLKHRTLSKIINKMEIQDIDLGVNFPVIKSVTPVNIQFVKDSSLLQNLQVAVDLEYTGGFQIAIDAVSRLSKRAMVKIKVLRLAGRGCLEVSRYPFTYWSFSFYEEPESAFEVDSTVLGRQIPRFKSIIVNQLKALLRRKHTLPYFKLRSNPLIRRQESNHVVVKPTSDDATFSETDDSDDICGALSVSLMKCSRLQPSLVGSMMYFSLTLSEVPLICAYETPVGIWIVMDILVHKPHATPFGILLRSAEDHSQIIETVSNKSLGFQAGLRKNDIVLAVNNAPLLSGPQAAKIFSSSYQSRRSGDTQEMRIRIKRLIYTDHKRATVETSLLETLKMEKDERSGSVPSSWDDLGIPISSSFPEQLEKLSSPDGESLVDAPCANLEPIISKHSTPNSTRSNSPETIRRCGSDVSFSSRPEDSASSFIASRGSASKPIQIPRPEIESEQSCHEPTSKSSSGHQGSKSGTPISFSESKSEFSVSKTDFSVPKSEFSMPPGVPILKMDAKSYLRKTPVKSKPIFKHFETSPVEASCDPVLGNEFKFLLDKNSKYLNVCVWSKVSRSAADESPVAESQTTPSKGVMSKLRKRDGKYSDKDERKPQTENAPRSEIPNPLTGHPDYVLVGFVNVSLIELIPSTRLNTRGSVTKIVDLCPADMSTPEFAHHSLLSHKGFDSTFCYGDLMFAAIYTPVDKLENGLEDDVLNDGNLSEEEESELNASQENLEDRDHLFQSTQFSSATQCDFCMKKIWLKNAYQCVECGISCHKKCMLRCEKATVCDPSGLRYRGVYGIPNKEDTISLPEIITTSVQSPQDNEFDRKSTSSKSSQSPRHALGSLLSHISSSSASIKRAGSAQNLSRLQSPESEFSRSLPPSPQHSRKNSLVENPFLKESEESSEHMENLLKRLLEHPRDENLVILARDTSCQLYSKLPPAERVDRIKTELDELHARVEHEGEIRVELAQQERSAQERRDDIEMTKVSLLITECDKRTQVLALLTMHYFTALQQALSCQEENIEKAATK